MVLIEKASPISQTGSALKARILSSPVVVTPPCIPLPSDRRVSGPVRTSSRDVARLDCRLHGQAIPHLRFRTPPLQ